MKLVPLKTLSVRIPGTLYDKLQEAAEQRGELVSEFTREALTAHLEPAPEATSHETLRYEVLKNRALLLRYLDTQLETSIVEELLEQAGADVTEYLRDVAKKE